MSDTKKKGFLTGYSKVSLLVNTMFNTVLSLFLIICASPFLVIVALLVKLQDGGPILYKGKRLGFQKRIFIMYKFRTLSPGADKVIGAELLTEKISSQTSLETPLGKVLRETRLDELPQLFNILKGDMDFIGPRPERPIIYEKFCKQIRGYDKRFEVKPGLIGYSQLFTPHSSPKRIRTIIDNKFLAKKQNILWDMLIVLLTITMVLGRIFHYGSRFIWTMVIKSKLLKMYKEQRKYDRIRIDNALISYGQDDSSKEHFANEAKLIDVNEDAILVYGKRIELDRFFFQMEITIPSLHGRKNRKKTALCHGTIYKRIKLDKNNYPYATIIKYAALSPLNNYMVHQYFLHKSII